MKPVHIARCDNYEPGAVDSAIREGIEALGGIGQFVLPGQRVLLKPNLLRPASPDRHITTHPEVVRAVANMVVEAGATPIILDSPGGPHNWVYLRTLYRTTGMAEVCESTGAELGLDTRSTEVSFPEGRRAKRIDMLALAREADLIINLPKLKTHGLTLLTGATKNLFGLVPGMSKLAYHSKWPDVGHFGDMLIDVLQCCAPRLTIMDAIWGMEGNGPSGGSPRQAGMVLASEDGVALDIVAAAAVGIDPLLVPPLRAARERGLTTGRPADVAVSGLSLGNARLHPPFVLPETLPGEGSGLLQRIARLWPTGYLSAYPASNGACIGCGVCARACPVEAISIVEGRAIMNLDKCIRCYCCHELCPHDAIDLRRKALAAFLLGKR